MKSRLLQMLMIFLLIFTVFLPACGDDDDDDDDSGTDDDDAVDDDDDDNNTDDDDDDSGETGDFTATMVVNPICDISCVITWTTDEAASSWVEFGEEGQGYTLRIGSDESVTDHEVIVVGMHPSTNYTLQAVSETGAKERLESQEMSFSAPDLPEVWMAGDMDVYDKGQASEGWTLTNLAGGSLATALTAAMYDMDGEVIWYYQHTGDTGRMDTVISLINDDEILIGPGVPEDEKVFAINLKGDITWEGPLQVGRGMNDNGGLHHVLYQMDDGNFVTSVNDVRGGTIGDEIQVFDSDLNSVWTWNFWDHVTPGDVGPGGAWTHVNAVSFDLDNNYAYISSYNLGLIYKLDTVTDAIEWTLGEDGDFDPDPVADYPWFTGTHGIDYLGDGKILAYDNGNIDRQFSRAVIYQLDEINMEATIIWEYRGDDEADKFYNASVGDADMLENGNVLITAGNSAQNQSQTRFIEVTPDGDKVWQMWLYYEGSTRVASFQGERIPSLTEAFE